MKSMFYGCYSIESIDLTKITIVNSADMSFMFYGCYSLKIVLFPYIDYFNPSYKIKMNSMFYDCISLQSVNITGFRIYLGNTSQMFYNCENITSLQFNINFNT